MTEAHKRSSAARQLSDPAGEQSRAARGNLVFDVRGLRVALGDRRVLGPLDLAVPPGTFMGILGPNGSGKTTLLRALTGTVQPQAGLMLLEGRRPSELSSRELARRVGVVPQQFSLDFSFTVSEMVAMGRYAHGSSSRADRRAAGTAAAAAAISAAAVEATRAGEAAGFTRSTPGGGAATDGEAVAAALAETGLTDLSARLVTQLSGGERQRALIAQTLAQDTPTLLLDEPLNNLDLNHQLEIMQLLARLHDAGRTIVVVLHDLNMAAQYCDELVLLDQGLVAARGRPADVLDPRLILDVFRVRVAVHRQGRKPYITPLWTSPQKRSADESGTKVHVMAGGGAASEIIEDLVLHGFTPSVGIVSVFDTDYATAQRYELDVVSAPPFQPFPPDAVTQLETLVAGAEVVVVAPVYFGTGNLELLRVVLRAAQMGKIVLLAEQPPIPERDLSDGVATRLYNELTAYGAQTFAITQDLMERIRGSQINQ